MAPIEVSSLSNVGRVDSGKDCVNTYLEDVVTTTDSTTVIVTKEVASLEDEITTKATTQVEAFHSDIMDIANLIHLATEIILKEVALKVESKQPTPSNKGGEGGEHTFFWKFLKEQIFWQIWKPEEKEKVHGKVGTAGCTWI